MAIPKKLLFLDVETLGTDPKQDAVVQIAGSVDIIWQEGEPAKFQEEFNFKCRPFQNDHKLDLDDPETKNLLVNYYGANPDNLKETLDEILSRPEPEEVYKKFINILNKYIHPKYPYNKLKVVGANPRFDWDMMNSWFFKNSKNATLWKDKYVYYHCIDIQTIADMFKFLGKIKSKDLKLATISKKMDIQLENAHDALCDIRATKEIFYKFKKSMMACEL